MGSYNKRKVKISPNGTAVVVAMASPPSQPPSPSPSQPPTSNMTVMDSIYTAANAILASINSYISTHHDGVIALLLFTGVVISFSGRKLLKPTVFLLGFIPTTTLVTALGVTFIHDQPNPHPIFDFLTVLIALSLGVLVGIIMLRLLFRIATFLLCAGFGAVLILVAHLFLLEPATGPNAQFILFATAGFAALISGLFSVTYPETGIILGTAFDGAALSVFSLARFLGHRPDVLQSTQDDSPWWAIGYATATLLLGIFGAVTQRQVANADNIIASAKDARLTRSRNSDASMPFLPEEEQHLLPFEPPRTPPHLRSGLASPADNSGYGAAEHEDSQYSVVHNLGAGPLTPSMDVNNYKNGKDSNGPLPL